MSRAVSQLAGRRLILVDDEREVLQAATDLLASWDMEVRSTPSSRQALQWLGESPCDLLLTDLHLGEGDSGVMLLERARKAGYKGGATLWTADATFRDTQLPASLNPVKLAHKPLKPARLKRLLLEAAQL